eukprot:TRINITY_DN9876_c0_g1_i1.p1 TRINITY_DN9876_c0_g1~~TRINITY_DN9876_c0_g1_i1.p1  ORF type:complete len:141 (+),score=21.30 TRINITY_DN9876_c0_g1_i1:393-815(+)
MLAVARIRPVALQNQFSLYEPCARPYTEWLHKEGIALVGAASLNPTATANLNALKDPHVLQIAEAHGRTAAQVLLRWVLHRGAAVLPRSQRVERIRENSDLDFDLKSNEVALLNGVATLMHTRAKGSLRPQGEEDIYQIS